VKPSAVHISLKFLSLFLLLSLLVFTSTLRSQTTGPAPDESKARVHTEPRHILPPDVWGPPTTRPAEADSRPVTTRPIDVGKARYMAVRYALNGEFREALENLRSAQRIESDLSAAASVELLEQYVALRGRIESQRTVEYDEAVKRVRRALTAQAYLPKLIHSGLLPEGSDTDESEEEQTETTEQNLRTSVQDVSSAYGESDLIDELELCSTDEAKKLKADARASLQKAQRALSSAREMLTDDTSQYATMFRQLADVLQKKLREYAKTWESVAYETTKDRLGGAKRLREVQDELVDALGDLQAAVSATPWRIGLGQAKLAKMLAPEEAVLSEQDWYSAIKTIAESQGEKSVEQAKWYDALAAYSGLNDLEEDNERYRERVKAVRRHVRVVALYGQKRTATRPVETGTTWRDVVSDVDASMVRNAISEIGNYYVTDVDFRKIALGALEGVRILAETPQAANSFPRLGNTELRTEFIEAIRRDKNAFEKMDRVKEIHIQAALSAVLLASERTVRIPVEVLSVEFAESMVDELDQFSSIVWPYDATDFLKSTSGKFVGVGIQITKEPGKPLKVVTPLPGTPGFRHGIRSGDTIVAVDGQRTDHLSIDKLVRMITGEKDTRVVLSIRRPGMKKPKDYSIIREEVNIRTVKGWRRLPGGGWDYMLDPQCKIGYIRITQFTNQTVPGVIEALEQLRAIGLRSLILDMRFNPGGLLQSSTRVADQFLRSGRMVSTRGRPTRPMRFDAHPDGCYLDGDLVVLVNRYTASAAEIVSGAIKDLHRGIIVGERTYGKGSVQHVITIRRDKAYMRLTAAHYYLPSGRLLHRMDESEDWGVEPDITVQLTPKQTRNWLDLRRKTDLLQEVDPQQLAGDLEEQFEADIQLNTAVVLLRLMQLREVKAAA